MKGQMQTVAIIAILLVVFIMIGGSGIFLAASIASPTLILNDGCGNSASFHVYEHNKVYNELKWRDLQMSPYTIRHNEDNDYWMFCVGPKYVFADGVPVQVMDYPDQIAWRSVSTYQTEPITNAIDTGTECITIYADEIMTSYASGISIIKSFDTCDGYVPPDDLDTEPLTPPVTGDIVTVPGTETGTPSVSDQPKRVIDIILDFILGFFRMLGVVK